MKKQSILVLLLAVICIISSGCKKTTAPTNNSAAVPCTELCSSLMEDDLSLDCDIVCGYEDEQFETYFSYLYNIPMENIKDGCIIYVSSGSSADEVSLLLPADAGKGAVITTALNNRIEKRKQDYNGYNDDEVEKLNHALVTPIGNYIALVISDQPQSVVKALRQKL